MVHCFASPNPLFHYLFISIHQKPLPCLIFHCFNGKIKIMKKYLGILVLKLERLKNPRNYLITTRLYGPKNNNFMKKNNSTHVAFTAALLISQDNFSSCMVLYFEEKRGTKMGSMLWHVWSMQCTRLKNIKATKWKCNYFSHNRRTCLTQQRFKVYFLSAENSGYRASFFLSNNDLAIHC